MKPFIKIFRPAKKKTKKHQKKNPAHEIRPCRGVLACVVLVRLAQPVSGVFPEANQIYLDSKGRQMHLVGGVRAALGTKAGGKSLGAWRQDKAAQVERKSRSGKKERGARQKVKQVCVGAHQCP